MSLPAKDAYIGLLMVAPSEETGDAADTQATNDSVRSEVGLPKGTDLQGDGREQYAEKEYVKKEIPMMEPDSESRDGELASKKVESEKRSNVTVGAQQNERCEMCREWNNKRVYDRFHEDSETDSDGDHDEEAREQRLETRSTCSCSTRGSWVVVSKKREETSSYRPIERVQRTTPNRGSSSTSIVPAGYRMEQGFLIQVFSGNLFDVPVETGIDRGIALWKYIYNNGNFNELVKERGMPLAQLLESYNGRSEREWLTTSHLMCYTTFPQIMHLFSIVVLEDLAWVFAIQAYKYFEISDARKREKEDAAIKEEEQQRARNDRRRMQAEGIDEESIRVYEERQRMKNEERRRKEEEETKLIKEEESRMIKEFIRKRDEEKRKKAEEKAIAQRLSSSSSSTSRQ